jgi:peptidoglycan/LPS O-acetylase OafA/YrhL
MCADTPILLLSRISKYGAAAAASKTFLTFMVTTLMLKAWWPQSFMGLDDPNWSLSVEAFFYALFPLVAHLIWRRSVSGNLALLLGLYVVGLTLVSIIFYFHFDIRLVLYCPLLHVAEFFQGIALAKIYTIWMENAAHRVLLQRLSGWMAAWSITLLGAVIVWSGPTLKPILHNGGLLPAFAPLIPAFAAGNYWIERLFSSPLIVLLGEASYGLYLLHLVLWHYCERLINQWWSYPLYLFAAIAGSIISFRFFETPARKWILKDYRGRSAETLLVSSLAE